MYLITTEKNVTTLSLSFIQRDLLLKASRYKQVQDSHPSVEHGTEVQLTTYTQ
jgi:hypothetical protein